MAADEKWYFTKEQLANTPSRKCGYDADRELSCRQQAANFIQDMGQRLQVTQLCINTAIVYMHRFYVFHSFSHFHRNDMAVASLFLAAKVEEQPRKLEHVIKVAQMCLHREQHQARPVDTKSEQYLEQAQDLVINENILLQTLGFDVAIDHPHTHVVKCCHLVRDILSVTNAFEFCLCRLLVDRNGAASKDLAQTSYFMASNSLHLTTMCLLYKPTVVACFCIHLACKWSNWEIPQSNEGKSWFWYVDRTVTQELLEQLTDEFLRIFDKCSSRLKRKITSISASHNLTLLSGYPFPGMDRKKDGQQSNIPNFHAQPVQQPQTQPLRSRASGAIIGPPRTIVGGGDDLQKRLASTLGPLPQTAQSASPSPQTLQKTPSLDFKKTTATTHHSRDTGYSSSSYHGNGTPSSTSAPNSSTPGSSASYSSESPSIPPSSKHSGSRPECIFPPPTRSAHHSGPPLRTEKQDRRSPIQQPHYKPSHPSRNGTSHPENSIPPDTKTFAVNHLQKNHVKGHDPSRQIPGANSESVSVSHREVKTIVNSVKTDPFSSFSVQQPPIPRQPPPPPPPVSLPPPPAPTKLSSIFSPEKVTPPSSSSPKDIKPSVPVVFNSLKSPPIISKNARNRTSSSSSEPELVPFMTKLEDMTGFESIARGKTAIKLTGKVPDLIPPREKKREPTPVMSTAETKAPDLLRPSSFSMSEVVETVAFEQVDTKEKAHKKKKKRKEHKEHKDRDKDKKQKHKDKARAKHHCDPAPIKITIPKDKLNQILLTPSSSPSHDAGHRLKIKIPKEKITPPSGLKIKISKDGVVHSSSKDRNHSSSRKRERTSSHDDERPSKMSRGQGRISEQITSTNDLA